MRGLLAALLLLVAASAHATGRTPDFHFGVGTHAGIGRDSFDRIEPLLGELGAGALRDDLLWSRVQKKPGAFVPGPEVAQIDALVEAASANGRSVVLILAYGNGVMGVKGFPRTETERGVFANYVRWVVDRYRGRVRYFEVWNEWNAGLGSSTRPRTRGRASDYVELLRTVYPAIKSIAPDSVVLGGSIEGTDTGWFREFLSLGGPAYLDGISLHPYVHHKGRSGLPERSMAWLDDMHELLAASAEWRSKRFYVTEMGWPNSSSPQGVPIQDVAAYLLRFTSLARTRSWIAGVWWYELLDGGATEHNNEHNFGLFRRNGTAKESAAAARMVSQLLGRFDVWDELDVGAETRIVRARNSAVAGQCLIAWSVWGRDARIVLASNSRSLARLLGDAPYELAGGEVRLRVSTAPQVWCVQDSAIEVAQ